MFLADDWSAVALDSGTGELPSGLLGHADNHALDCEELEAPAHLVHFAPGHACAGTAGTEDAMLYSWRGSDAVEVIAIKLDDIDWRGGEVTARGKGKLHDRLSSEDPRMSGWKAGPTAPGEGAQSPATNSSEPAIIPDLEI